jgi:hypothetical protein
MSYEQGALGHSPVPWWQQGIMLCPPSQQMTCVTSDPVDMAWVNQRVGSSSRCTQYRNMFNGVEACTTTSGNPGTMYCCKQLTASQEAMVDAGVDPYAPVPTTPGGAAAAVICTSQRTPRDAMPNDRQRAVWDVKDALCRVGVLSVDPGPVNGEITDRLASAIRRFQTDNGLSPVNGRVSASTLSSLGFTWLQAQRILGALRGTFVGPQSSLTDLLIPLVIVGGLGVGGFALYRRFFAR